MSFVIKYVSFICGYLWSVYDICYVLSVTERTAACEFENEEVNTEVYRVEIIWINCVRRVLRKQGKLHYETKRIDERSDGKYSRDTRKFVRSDGMQTQLGVILNKN